MTFQVGLVGNDGVVLASDKRVRDVRGGLVTTFDTDKIVVLDDLHLAYCFAGDLLARHAAHLIVTELKKHTHPLPHTGPVLQGILQDSATRAWDSEFRVNSGLGGNPLSGGTVTLVYRSSEGVQLWHLVVCQDPYAIPIGNKISSGELTSPAVFFLERYYPESTPRPATKDLVPLAAHCVLMAGALNPAGVGGLEMLICTKAESTKLSTEAELAPFLAGSKKLDMEIAKSLKRWE